MTFEKILVALDGSESGQIAANYAFYLANKLDASLTAQHVVDPKLIQLFLDPQFGQELGFKSVSEIEKKVFNALRKIGNSVLELFRNEAFKRKVNVSTTLDEGRVAERIIDYSSKFDLLIIGHHGKTQNDATLRLPLGSVAERVVLGANIPVLIAIEPFSTIEQIIVAYDGSEASRGALRMSENLAKRIGAKLKVIVVDHLEAGGSETKLLVEDGQKFLRETWDEDVFSIKRGAVRDAILGETANANHSLLVLGAYGYKTPEENVLGSTATNVIRNTRTSVLIFRSAREVKSFTEKQVSFVQTAI